MSNKIIIYLDSEFYKKLESFVQGNHEYYTTHNKLCYFIIERIYRRVKNGYYFGGIKIDIKEKLILDGNHRYIAYKLAGVDFNIIPYTKNHHNIEPYPNICDIKIDIIEDWDKNNPENEKYCSDDFLSERNYKREE